MTNGRNFFDQLDKANPKQNQNSLKTVTGQ